MNTDGLNNEYLFNRSNLYVLIHYSLMYTIIILFNVYYTCALLFNIYDNGPARVLASKVAKIFDRFNKDVRIKIYNTKN